MARVWSSGFELNSLTAGVEFTGVGSEQTIDTVTVRTGTYSLKCLTADSGSNSVYYQFAATTQNGLFYFREYFYLHQAPSANNIDILGVSGTNSLHFMAHITMNINKTLTLYDQFNGIQIGSASAVLTLDTWYRIELKVDTTTLSAVALDARINGVSFASGTVDWSLDAGIAIAVFGNLDSLATSYTFYLDDLAINDSTGSFQNTYPGAGQIVHLKPSAAGDNNTFTVAVGGTAGAGNNFTRVKEVTPNDATDYNADITSGDIDDFNIDDTPASIGSSDTINVVHVGVRYAAAIAAAEAAFVVRCKKAASGTVSESSAITPNSTAWDTNANAAPRNYPVTLYQDPDAGSWTKATLDTAQIGYRISTTNTNAARISTAWMLVDSTPAAAGANTWTGSNLTMLKAG